MLLLFELICLYGAIRKRGDKTDQLARQENKSSGLMKEGIVMHKMKDADVLGIYAKRHQINHMLCVEFLLVFLTDLYK